MTTSAIERELQNGFIRLRGFFKSHDRGVVLGLIFSCIPLPPLALIGFFISLLNLWIWKNHKLNYDEIKIIRPALMIAALNILLGTLILYFVLATFFGTDWLHLIKQWHSWITGALYSLWPFSWLPHSQGGYST